MVNIQTVPSFGFKAKRSNVSPLELIRREITYYDNSISEFWVWQDWFSIRKYKSLKGTKISISIS